MVEATLGQGDRESVDIGFRFGLGREHRSFHKKHYQAAISNAHNMEKKFQPLMALEN